MNINDYGIVMYTDMLITMDFAETKRLILRRFRESDLQDLHEYLSDPEVVALSLTRP